MKQIKNLKDLQEMPVMVRMNTEVLDDGDGFLISDKSILGKEIKLAYNAYKEDKYIIEVKDNLYSVDKSSAQILTPIESPKYKGEHIAIGDWIGNEVWYEVCNYYWNCDTFCLLGARLDGNIPDYSNIYSLAPLAFKDHKKLSEINNSTFDKISNNVDGLTEPSIWFEQSKKKIEKLSGSFAFTDNDHNVQDKINEIIDHLNNQNN